MLGVIRAAFLILCVFGGEAFASSWTVVSKSSGITVQKQEVPGQSLPFIRGTILLGENIYDILAVMQDFSRHVEWMHDCKEAERLANLDDWTTLVYSRTDAPWPVQDRDVVLKSVLKAYPREKRVSIGFNAIPVLTKPPLKGVVRMESLSGGYELEYVHDKRTRVEFTIRADPGGWLPGWVATMVSSEIPFYTLRNLKDQVEKTRGLKEYKPFILKAKSIVTGEAGESG